MLLDADGRRVRRVIGFGPPVFVRVSDSPPEVDIALIGESMEVKEIDLEEDDGKRPRA